MRRGLTLEAFRSALICHIDDDDSVDVDSVVVGAAKRPREEGGNSGEASGEAPTMGAGACVGAGAGASVGVHTDAATTGSGGGRFVSCVRQPMSAAHLMLACSVCRCHSQVHFSNTRNGVSKPLFSGRATTQLVGRHQLFVVDADRLVEAGALPENWTGDGRGAATAGEMCFDKFPLGHCWVPESVRASSASRLVAHALTRLARCYATAQVISDAAASRDGRGVSYEGVEVWPLVAKVPRKFRARFPVPASH